MAIADHFFYLSISIAFTVQVGQSLFTNGRLFLLECLGDERTADSINRLFLTGFYLMNLGFVLLVLRFGETGASLEQSLEFITGRVGFVALIMGGMHFNNLFWCDFVRRRRNRCPITTSSESFN